MGIQPGWLWVLVAALALPACGGGSKESAGKTAAFATLCGPRFNLVEPGSTCPGGLCRSGVVAGSATDIGTMNFSSSDAMCTKPCSTGTDCLGMSFPAANGVTVVAEIWACLATAGGSYCAVGVVAPSGGGNSCSICGGAFCGGDCIGCPQCP
jgi:hypothetical protein